MRGGDPRAPAMPSRSEGVEGRGRQADTGHKDRHGQTDRRTASERKRENERLETERERERERAVRWRPRAAPDYVDLALRPGPGPSPLYALTADGHLLLFGGAGARALHRWVELGRAPSAGRPLAVSATARRGRARTHDCTCTRARTRTHARAGLPPRAG